MRATATAWRGSAQGAARLEQALNGLTGQRQIEITPHPRLERGATILETSQRHVLREIEVGSLDIVRAMRATDVTWFGSTQHAASLEQALNGPAGQHQTEIIPSASLKPGAAILETSGPNETPRDPARLSRSREDQAMRRTR